jgi:RES domain-containing protein
MLRLYHELTSDTVDYGYEDPLQISDTLLDLVQDDWDVFSETLLESGNAGKLLENIANAHWDDDSGENPLDADELYTRRPSIWHSSLKSAFAGVVSELSDNPDDPGIPTKLAESLGEHFSRVARTIPNGEYFFRGRPGCASPMTPYSGGAIGAPPPVVASPGRANPAGVSMLYVADVAATAVAELQARALHGPISLYRVRTARDVRVLNLVDGYPQINPFTESEETLFWEIEIADLLILLGEELAKPVQNDDDPQEYRITQQLCAAIRDAGYDGIMYPSTRRDGGVNLVLFDGAAGDILESWLEAGASALARIDPGLLGRSGPPVAAPRRPVKGKLASLVTFGDP